MTTPKSVKIASAVSIAAVMLWFLMTIFIYMFQDSVINLYMVSASLDGENERIFLASTFIQFISAAVVAVCGYLMINGKTTLTPLILSASAALLTSPAADIARSLQLVLSARLIGSDYLQRVSALSSFSGYASYILNGALVCTACASAVYAYAKKMKL